jgi:hypothetical protein
VGSRLEGLAEHHPLVVKELLTIAANVRNVATVLSVLVATKLRRDGYGSGPAKKPV